MAVPGASLCPSSRVQHWGVGSLRQRDDLPRIHDVQRIERTLDLAHDVEAGAELRLQVLHLALADAVLPGAGAVHRDSALGKALEEVLDLGPRGRIIHREHGRGMEVAITDVAYDRRDDAVLLDVFLGL